jgi:subtilase family serine protease
VNLAKAKFGIFPVLSAITIVILFASPTFASSSPVVPQTTVRPLHTESVSPIVSPLDPNFNASALVGGAPFCTSASLGTILCYPPSFLKKAYNFPSTFGVGGLDGRGSTIVIVDAFGSPTVQSDLNAYDKAFGLAATTITILCGPTWTGAATDNCPVKTISDLSTANNAGICGASGWAEETTLDVTQAHALAPGAKIVLVVANDCYDSSIYSAEMAVVTQHRYAGSVMSQSFGEPDDLVTCTVLDPTYSYCTTYDPTLLNLPNQVFQTATMNHWTIIASTGDSGANENYGYLNGANAFSLTPAFPATSPLVLAAGGTQGYPYGGQYGSFPGPGGAFTCPAGKYCNTGLVVINGGRYGCTTAARPGEPTSCVPVGYGGEGTWNEFLSLGGVSSSGGGVSTLYSRPFYQLFTPRTVTTLLGASVTVTGRATPDVSFNSASYGGVLAYVGFYPNPGGTYGRWVVFGGTSAASPAWAGIIALLNQANHRPVGFINPAIYALGMSRSFFGTPSTSGTDGFFGASPYHDITVGNNSLAAGYYGIDGYVATKGYDMATGWGTPNVSVFINDILPLVSH